MASPKHPTPPKKHRPDGGDLSPLKSDSPQRPWGEIVRYAVISFCVLCAVGILALLLWKGDQLVAWGLTGNLYYPILSPMGLAAAGFLFGVPLLCELPRPAAWRQVGTERTDCRILHLYELFFSYRRDDLLRAQALPAVLEAVGLRVLRDKIAIDEGALITQRIGEGSQTRTLTPEVAKRIAGHVDSRTTELYDCRGKRCSWRVWSKSAVSGSESTCIVRMTPRPLLWVGQTLRRCAFLSCLVVKT